jgi:UPF0755 protein
VLSRVADLGLVDSRWKLKAYAWLARAGAPQAGPHLLPPRASPARLLDCLARNRRRAVVRLTIPEGYDRFQIAQRLESSGITPAAAFGRASEDRELLAALEIDASSAEGFLFPATYDLYENSLPERVLSRLVREMRTRYARIESDLADELRELRERHAWTIREVLTLASIVEREAADADEHAAIASVFHNRLGDESFRPRKRLQSDPTAAYGCRLLGDTLASCRDFSGKVTPEMLRDGNNPYNTYRHSGLPPGPIASPSESAIRAAIKPAVTPYFFFVSHGGRRHVFTRTLDEHREAIGNGSAAQAAPAP